MSVSVNKRVSVPSAVEDIGILALGGTKKGLPAGFRSRAVSNAEEGFDVIVVLAPIDNQQLAAARSTARNWLAPILDFSGNHRLMADFWDVQLTSASLEEGLLACLPILQRMARLPRLTDGPDRKALCMLGMAYTRATKLEAQLCADRKAGVHYHLLDGLGATHEILDELYTAGLLSRRFFDRTHLCDVCGSSRLNVREVCEGCTSSDVATVSIIHHYRCGHQAPESDFTGTGNNQLHCPKCREQLRHLGVDYSRPGQSFVCNACDERMSDPQISFACMECYGETAADRAETRSWYHYELTSDGEQALMDGQLSHNGLQHMISALQQASSPERFVVVFEQLMSVSKRYKRDLTVGTMQLVDLEAFREEVGSRAAHEALKELSSLVSEVLRETDLLTVVDGHLLLMALPETSISVFYRVEERIREGLVSRAANALQYEFKEATGDEAAQLVREVLQA